MKEFIEKLIGRLEENQEIYRGMADACKEILPRNFYFGRMYSFADAIEIVNELAKEYNDGWITCSERLPNKEEYLKDDGRFIVTDGNRSYEGTFDIYRGKFQRDCFAAVIEDDKCVIAWQPLPEPYKGE